MTLQFEKKKDNVISLFVSFLSPWQQVSFSIKVIQDHLKLKSRQQPSAQKGKYWHGFKVHKKRIAQFPRYSQSRIRTWKIGLKIHPLKSTHKPKKFL